MGESIVSPVEIESELILFEYILLIVVIGIISTAAIFRQGILHRLFKLEKDFEKLQKTKNADNINAAITENQTTNILDSILRSQYQPWETAGLINYGENDPGSAELKLIRFDRSIFDPGSNIIDSRFNIKGVDCQFLDNLIATIQKHLSEEDFSIEELSLESGMSRSKIYKKLKTLTGRSPSMFVRSIKLKQARKMILDHKKTISEIAYSVGFGSPSYFTKCFKEEFGCSPRDLLGRMLPYNKNYYPGRIS